jgi:enamine deaminase RidA (YjgF/YER057c/UK114 family)
MNSQVVPAAIAPPAANYAHGVVSTGPVRLLHTAGTVAVRPDGTVPTDLAAQAETVWANLSAILDEAGMAPTDVVSVTTYVVAGEDLRIAMAARDRALGGHRAASTLVVVPALARPEWRMEIALVAAAEQ